MKHQQLYRVVIMLHFLPYQQGLRGDLALFSSPPSHSRESLLAGYTFSSLEILHGINRQP